MPNFRKTVVREGAEHGRNGQRLLRADGRDVRHRRAVHHVDASFAVGPDAATRPPDSRHNAATEDRRLVRQPKLQSGNAAGNHE